MLWWVVLSPAFAGSGDCDEVPPKVADMDADDLVCVFVDELAEYRRLGRVRWISVVTGVPEAVPREGGREPWARGSLRDEHADARVGSTRATEQFLSPRRARRVGIEAWILGTVHFARYAELRGASSDTEAWHSLERETARLWYRSERGRYLAQMRVSADLRRDREREWRALPPSDRSDWGVCPPSTAETGEPPPKSNPIEYIWARIPKSADGTACYVEADIEYLYRLGFVDDLRVPFEVWEAAILAQREPNNTFVFDHEEFLGLAVYRADAENAAARERVSRETQRIRADRERGERP